MPDNTVSIDGWSCTDGPKPSVDSRGCAWVLQSIDGWWGGLDVRSAPVDRPDSDGVFDANASFGGRTVTLGGTVSAPNRAELQRAMTRVANVLAGTSRVGTLVVHEALTGLSLSASVRLGGPTMVERESAVSAKWSVSMFAPNPDRVSSALQTATTSTNGSVAVFNDGNRAAWPVISIHGPVNYPAISTSEGGSLSIAVGVPFGSTLVIDCFNRTIRLDGVSKRAALASGYRWFSFPPGGSTLSVGGSGGGIVDINWRDTWS